MKYLIGYYYSLGGVILAGGKASRLKNCCKNIPKGLVEFNNYPFLTYLVSWLHRCGCNPIVLSIGFLGEEIESIFNTTFWRNMGTEIRDIPMSIRDSPLDIKDSPRSIRESAEKLLLCHPELVSGSHPRIWRGY